MKVTADFKNGIHEFKVYPFVDSGSNDLSGEILGYISVRYAGDGLIDFEDFTSYGRATMISTIGVMVATWGVVARIALLLQEGIIPAVSDVT